MKIDRKVIFFWILLLILGLIYKEQIKYGILNLILGSPNLGPVFFILAHILSSMLFFSCTAFPLIAGYVWGLKSGFFLCLISNLLCLTINFLLSRFFLCFEEERHSNILIKKVKLAVKKYKWKAAFFVNINPILPGSSLGIVFGKLNISFLSYIIGAFFGSLPLILILVYWGSIFNKV